jgi:hypothetical protein
VTIRVNIREQQFGRASRLIHHPQTSSRSITARQLPLLLLIATVSASTSLSVVATDLLQCV